MRNDQEPEPVDIWRDEGQEIAEAVDRLRTEEQYSATEEGIRLFFQRLHAGWRVDRGGRLCPPKDGFRLPRPGEPERAT